jgi:hypothetical protein
MTISLPDFFKRLDDLSKDDGIPYGRAYRLIEKEKEYGLSALSTFKGLIALSDAFKCFFLETVEILNTECMPKITTPLSDFYPLFIPRLVHSFQTLCGAERIALHGYPYQAFTLLRNTFDNILLTSAALQKITDFYSIEGVEPGKPSNLNSIRKLRKATEHEVRKKMTGDQSGLTQPTIDTLNEWDALFDYEVHGARLSLALTTEWMKGLESLPVLPSFKEKPFALFANRFVEVGWMTHRLVPLMQPLDVLLSEAWKEKWQALDESFETGIDALTAELGKKIGAVIIEFVKAKFPFNEQSTFPL